MTRRAVTLPLLALATIAACLSGCGKSSTTPDPVPVDPWVIPSTSDKLMLDFQLAYETMDPARLAQITDPQSLIVLRPRRPPRFRTWASSWTATNRPALPNGCSRRRTSRTRPGC